MQPSTISTYCFEVYKHGLFAHEGLLRTMCTESTSIQEASDAIEEMLAKKYEFKTYFVRK